MGRRLSAVLLALMAIVPAHTRAQAPRRATDIELPPLSYVCPMPGDEEVIEDRAGTCRKCGMTLVPIRLDSGWTCARQPLLMVSDTPGKCPADGTPLGTCLGCPTPSAAVASRTSKRSRGGSARASCRTFCTCPRDLR